MCCMTCTDLSLILTSESTVAVPQESCGAGQTPSTSSQSDAQVRISMYEPTIFYLFHYCVWSKNYIV